MTFSLNRPPPSPQKKKSIWSGVRFALSFSMIDLTRTRHCRPGAYSRLRSGCPNLICCQGAAARIRSGLSCLPPFLSLLLLLLLVLGGEGWGMREGSGGVEGYRMRDDRSFGAPYLALLLRLGMFLRVVCLCVCRYLTFRTTRRVVIYDGEFNIPIVYLHSSSINVHWNVVFSRDIPTGSLAFIRVRHFYLFIYFYGYLLCLKIFF